MKMAYTPHEWTNKELITAEKLNHIEKGVKEAADGEAESVKTTDTYGIAGEAGDASNVQALLDELAHRSGGQYKPGDEFIISADTAGFVTSSRREVRVSVYTDKPLSEDITSASLVSGKANVIQAGNYLIGAVGDAADLLDYTCKVTIRSRSCLSISVTSESIYTNSVNNDAAGVILREVQIKFE